MFPEIPVMLPKFGIFRINGICLVDNKAPVKVMERCGFGKECEGMGDNQGEKCRVCKFSNTL